MEKKSSFQENGHLIYQKGNPDIDLILYTTINSIKTGLELMKVQN